MKTILSALIVLSVLAGIVPASAFDAKSFFDQHDRTSGNPKREWLCSLVAAC
jgi:hypothetical protein